MRASSIAPGAWAMKTATSASLGSTQKYVPVEPAQWYWPRELITPEMRQRVEAAREDIIAGKIKVTDYMAKPAQ